VSPTKTAEPIEMPFGLRTWIGPGNHVLDGGADARMGRGNFEGEGASHCKVQGHSSHLCKMAEPIEMPFGLLDFDGPKESCVRWGSRC